MLNKLSGFKKTSKDGFFKIINLKIIMKSPQKRKKNSTREYQKSKKTK